MKKFCLWLLILCFVGSVEAQFNWLYQYEAPGDGWDGIKSSMVLGADNNLYLCDRGYYGYPYYYDMVVISLSIAGTENWVYRYNGPANGLDWTNDLIYGAGFNLYIAGVSYGDSTSADFIVLSLDTAGQYRWEYRYNFPLELYDEAYSLVQGPNSYLYIAGTLSLAAGKDMGVISLDTSGTERWVYYLNGTGNADDEAFSIVYGSDNRLYFAGYTTVGDSFADFTVVSLDTAGGTMGSERWYYRYNGPGNGEDVAYSLIYGNDGNIYAAGYTTGSGTFKDWTVISLDTAGTERWIYQLNGPENSDDVAYKIIYGEDNNLYITGYLTSDTGKDFTVISLDTAGTERWVYKYNGPGNSDDEGYFLVYDAGGNLDIAGYATGLDNYKDFTAISLDTAGQERWIYQYNGTGSGVGLANSIVYGIDSTLYIGGHSTVNISRYITVISLGPLGDIEETAGRSTPDASRLQVWPNPFTIKTTIRFTIQDTGYKIKDESQKLKAENSSISLKIYDATGRLIRQWDYQSALGGMRLSDRIVWSGDDDSGRKLPNGVYLVELRLGKESINKKVILLR